MEWEGLLQDQVLLQKELTMFDIQRRKRSKKMGQIPVSSQAELKSIALESREIQSNAFSWIDPTQQ
jgi:hypothetical protein